MQPPALDLLMDWIANRAKGMLPTSGVVRQDSQAMGAAGLDRDRAVSAIC